MEYTPIVIVESHKRLDENGNAYQKIKYIDSDLEIYTAIVPVGLKVFIPHYAGLRLDGKVETIVPPEIRNKARQIFEKYLNSNQ